MTHNWQSTASLAALRARAELMALIREFFAARKVLEIETPILAQHGVTDIHLEPITAVLNNKQYYLQTSPEYAMKRLLAQYNCSMFQLSKAFRAEESGKLHNPEFTILEWYQINYDHFQLMQEVDDLLQLVLHTKPAKKITYQELFLLFLNIDPLTAEIKQLQQCAIQHDINLTQNNSSVLNYDDWLSLLLTHCIEPKLQGDSPWFIYNYPKSQAALAKINPADPRVAERFEVYFKGIELANGYHELGDPIQHRERFIVDNQYRLSHKKELRTIDEYLLSALTAGLPACAGVALGVDRLLMLKLGIKDIAEVISFSVEVV